MNSAKGKPEKKRKARLKYLLLGFATALAALTSASRADTIYVGNAVTNTIEMFDTTTGADLGVFAIAPRMTPGINLWCMAFDSAGNLYAGYDATNTIEKFAPNGARSVFASSGPGRTSVSLAFDSAGNLFVVNGGPPAAQSTIMKFTPEGVGSVFTTNLGIDPSCLAFDGADNLFVTDEGANSVWKFTPAGVGSVFASSGMNYPYAMAFDASGNLYVSSIVGNTIEKFTPGGAGSAFASIGLNWPNGMAFDSGGNLYVVNYGNNTLEKFTPGGLASYLGTNGLNYPTCIAIKPSVFIRGQPQNQVSCLGGGAVFSVLAGGAPPLSYQWYFGSTPLTGQTNAQLTITNLQATNAGAYSVSVSNLFSGQLSSSAQLTLNDACVDIGMYAGLSISGLKGTTYVLKFTTDLGVTNFADWTPLATNTLGSSNWFYLDLDSPFSPRRFYGVKLAQ